MAFGAFAPPPLRNLGPVLTPFPKAATNIAGVPVSAQHQPTIAETLLQLAQMMDVGSQNQLRQLQGKQIQQKMEMTPQLMNFITKFGGGAAGTTAGTAGQPDAATAQPAVYGSLAPATPSAAGSSGLLASPKDSGVAGSQVFQALKGMGASDNEAALLTSAAQSESSFNPNITHDGGIGYGLFGHNGERLDAMRASAGVGPGLPVPMDAQLKFALNELRNRPEGAAVNSVTTPEGLTDLQMQFERPNRNINNGNYDQRLAATRQYMGMAGGGPAQVAQNVPQRSAAPVYGSLAPGDGTASPSIDPLDIAKAGAMSEVLGFPNIFKPFGEYYYNSPGYIAQKAGAEKAGAYPWAGPTAAAEAAGAAPYKSPAYQALAGAQIFPQGSPQRTTLETAANKAAGIEPFIGGQRPTVPLIKYNAATGQYELAQPQGYAQAAGGLASTAAAGTEAGKAGVQYGNLFGAQPPQGQSASKPVVTPQGTVVPPLSQQVTPPSPAELHAAIPAWQKKVDEWTNSIEPARQAEMRLHTIADAFKMTEPGTFATQKAALGGALKALGLDPSLAGSTDPAAVQLALHENYLQTLNRLKAATSRFTQQEFLVTSQQSEHPDLQPEANLQMLAEDIATLRHAQQLPADWNTAQTMGWRNPQAFESAWTQRNPLSKTVDQVKQEIGPLKGMGKPLDDAIASSARDAIAKGAPRNQVIKRLRDSGYDARGL